MARSCRLALLVAAGAVGVAAGGASRAALRGAEANGNSTGNQTATLRGAEATSNSTGNQTATLPSGAAKVGFTATPCDCQSGCADHHCSAVNDVFGMINWDRDGPNCKDPSESGCQGGALLHMIGSPSDVDGLLGDDGRIDWLDPKSLSFGGSYRVINDCQYNRDENEKPCTAAAVLRSDILPIVFNYPEAGSAGSVHPIGLLFDPLALQESYSIKGMFVLDADTVDYKLGSDNHPACTMESGWDWPHDYNAAGGTFYSTAIGDAMTGQCYFGLEDDWNWAGFWGNFIDARKAFQREIRDGDTSALPDDSSYLEPEIDLEIVDDAAWDSMYNNALKAVVVQTNYCSDQLAGDAVGRYCTDADEDSVIRLAKLSACRVALQIKEDTGNDLPVIEASLLTNAMYNEGVWEQFRSGDDYIAKPEDYMQYYDCCWLLNDLMKNDEATYNDLLAVGWYDNQCCWEQDVADEGWKNCDYCTNCKQ